MKREISSLKLSDENVARTLLDVIALLSHANCELIQRRRDLIRPDLNNQYQQICAEHVGFTDLLFRNDLPKQIQDISATNRVGQKLKSSTKANDHHRKSHFSKTAKLTDRTPATEDNAGKSHSLHSANGRRRWSKNSRNPQFHSVSVSKDCKLVDSKTQPGTFKAGRIKGYLLNWGKLTTDPHILNMVQGCQIDFDQLPHQRQPPCQHQLSHKEAETISAEIEKLVLKGVLLKSSHEEGEFLSTIFLRPKKDGTHRMILNLKKLNKFVAYHHFKMESLKHVVSMIRPNCFTASVDLKDAYYSVPIHRDHHKYLKIEWQGQLYQFTCLPNSLACVPRLFTKLLKPAYSTLRKQGFQSVGYIDDSCATTKLFDSLGRYVNPDKSILEPSQVLEFLGFVLNSVTMTVTLSNAKAENIKQVCKDLLNRTHPTIMEVAVVIGRLVPGCPGVAMGPLFYRQLENEKTAALKFHLGNFDESMVLSPTAESDPQWWVQNIGKVSKPILQGNPSPTLNTDASLQGWGAVFQGQSSGGRWAPAEAHQHINCLELKAAHLGLQSFCRNLSHTHVRIFVDNTTAVSYINNMGGTHSLGCSHIARTIWMWCIARDTWLSAAHLPGKCNTAADKASRIFHDQTEWKLDSKIYVSITQALGAPCIDCIQA